MRSVLLRLAATAGFVAVVLALGISAWRDPGDAPEATGRSTEVTPVLDRLTRGRRLVSGEELVMVFVGSANCGASTNSALPPLIKSAERSLNRLAQQDGARLVLVGVALDWSAFDGLGYLQSIGSFDEVIAGRNWANTAALEYIWEGHPGPPSLPQVLLLRREMKVGVDGINVLSERVVARKVGLTELTDWVGSLESEGS